jgi:uncharacterized OsmC-like protein
MSATMMKSPKPLPDPRNGVDTPALLTTINAVGAQPELAKFKWRATSRWQQGTHSRAQIASFYGAGSEQMHAREFTFDADHPAVLTGRDNGATPVEILLVALAACLTAGIGNIAAVRRVTLYEVECQIEGDHDLRGLLGLSDAVRSGFDEIRVNFKIKGDAPEEKLKAIVEQSSARSAVFDVVSNGTQVKLSVNAA